MLNNKKEILGDIFDNLNDIIWSISWPDLEVKFVSRAVKDIIGYSAAEFMSDPLLFQKVTHPEDRFINDQVLEKLKKDGYAERELRLISKEGSIKWIHDKAKLFYDQDAKPIRLEGVMRDITKRKKAEEKLKYNRQRYETIFKSAPIGIMIEDAEGEIIEVNPGLCQMTDFTKEDLEGANVLDKFVLPEYKELARKNIRRIIAGEDLEFDIETPKKSGEIIYKYLKETNIVLPGGQKGIISMHIDITDRKMMEKELKEKNILLNSILESIQDGVCVLNPDLTIRYTNAKMDEWYQQGLPLKDKKCFKGLYGQAESCEDCPAVQSLKNKKMESKIKKLPDWHDLDYIEIFSYPIFEEEGEKITGIVEFVRDITEQKKREREIKYLLYRDSLTELYNRRFFEEEMKRLDTRRQLPISIIMADVNGLKIINDSYGHDTGDQLLRKAAEILKNTVREEDILARQGGDEFAVLLPKTSQKEVQLVVSRIKNEIAAADQDEIPLSIALGEATKTELDQELTEVLKKADNRMYQNKLSVSRSSKSKIVQGLLNILEAKSSETKEHAVRMTKMAFDFGERLGLSNSELNRLSLLATLHDIGKTNINQNILNKPGSLNKKEWELMKNHSEQGYKIASSSEEFALVADDIFAHHENWDGSGYPRQLAGEDIPYLARIIAIIDAFDVMTHERPYSQAVTEKEALKEIESCAGSQFDPELAAEFIDLIRVNIK